MKTVIQMTENEEENKSFKNKSKKQKMLNHKTLEKDFKKW